MTNSDLVKIVKRRKEKIEKKIQKNQEDSAEDKIFLTSAQTDSFKTDNQELHQEETSRSAAVLFEESEIFIPECPLDTELIRNEACWEQPSYEFEKFITF